MRVAHSLGEASCPICGLEGICEGTAIHFEVVTSETGCEVRRVVAGYIERGNTRTLKMSAIFFSHTTYQYRVVHKNFKHV